MTFLARRNFHLACFSCNAKPLCSSLTLVWCCIIMQCIRCPWANSKYQNISCNKSNSVINSGYILLFGKYYHGTNFNSKPWSVSCTFSSSSSCFSSSSDNNKVRPWSSGYMTSISVYPRTVFYFKDVLSHSSFISLIYLPIVHIMPAMILWIMLVVYPVCVLSIKISFNTYAFTCFYPRSLCSIMLFSKSNFCSV